MTDNERAARKKKIMNVIMWVVLLIVFICFITPFILVIINWGSLMCDGRYNPMIINSPQIYYDIKYGIFALR